jgi:putative heme-binding domain-containing protein
MKSIVARAALVFLMLTLALLASAFFFPLTDQRIDLASGRATFIKHCNRCHSLDTTGKAEMGPNLANIAKVAPTRIPEMIAEEYIWESIVYPDRFKSTSGIMPAGFGQTLSETELRNLVAFLTTQGSSDRPNYRYILSMKKATEDVKDFETVEIPLDNILQGHFLFTDKYRCTNCHHTGEAYIGSDFLGPSLNSVGLYDRNILKESIRYPSNSIHPGYKEIKAMMLDGTVVTGRVLRQTEDSAVLLQVDGQGKHVVVEIDFDDLEENSEGMKLIPQNGSSMPPWDTDQMPDLDLERIVDFLTVLRG